MGALRLKIYTHPACTGCGDAVKLGWDLSQRFPELELLTCSLQTKEGLEDANQTGVKLIPTSIFYKDGAECKRFVGQTSYEELEETYLSLIPD